MLFALTIAPRGVGRTGRWRSGLPGLSGTDEAGNGVPMSLHTPSLPLMHDASPDGPAHGVSLRAGLPGTGRPA